MEQRFTIGKVAAAAGVNVETIRFYHRRGLLMEPEKEAGGFRYYDEGTIAQLALSNVRKALVFRLMKSKGSCG
jgi:MerR family mercuric resistance operon transcriptional regulator